MRLRQAHRVFLSPRELRWLRSFHDHTAGGRVASATAAVHSAMAALVAAHERSEGPNHHRRKETHSLHRFSSYAALQNLRSPELYRHQGAKRPAQIATSHSSVSTSALIFAEQ